MRRINKPRNLGVTLLEIMLVLAIAATIIVLSVRYYQAATNSQQSNLALTEIQAISAAADNLAIGPGTYVNVDKQSVTNIVGANNMISPTGGDISISDANQTGYTVTIPLSPAVCETVRSQVVSNRKLTGVGCDGSGNFSYTYTNSPI